MKMHLLPVGRLRMRKATFYPDAAREDMLVMPVSCALLRHAQGNVMFDSGCHPDVPRDPAARWGGLGKFMTPLHAPSENAITGLAALGLGPDDIDVAICSHLHPDHCGCAALFRRATIICHLAAAGAEGARERNGYLSEDWQGVTFTEIDGEHDLFGDGKIVLLHMPGHTPGLLCGHIALEREGTFLLASDAVSVAASLEHDYAPRNTWNAEALLRSMAEIRRIAAAGATVLCGHDAAQWAGLRKSADFYE
jgi:glyoxylase-like metal-dependent hydrolase (beta-lactamase superfamily II)